MAHREYRSLSAADLAAKVVDGGCFIDVKSAFHAEALPQAGLRVWRL